MASAKGRFSRLYAKIIACFVCMVLFSSTILIFASLWFFDQTQNQFSSKLSVSVDNVTQRLNTSVLSVYDLCTMVAGNALVQENFKPYERLTARNLYYYSSIIELLRQSRLQFDGVVDSVFLFADEQRVLYSMNEKGMASLPTFFSRFMKFQTYDKAYWEALLYETGARFTILAADRYETSRVHDARQVIPLVYLTTSMGHPNILVMNLSVEKILALYADSASDHTSIFLLYDQNGRLLSGPENAPRMDVLDGNKRVTYQKNEYFVTRTEQAALGIVIYQLTPLAAYLNMSSYFRLVAIGLTGVFAICGLFLALFMSKRTYAPIREVGENLRSAQDTPDNAAANYLTDELTAIKNGINRLTSERESFKTSNRQHSWHYVTQGLATLLDGRSMDDEMYFVGLLEQEYGFYKHGYRCADVLLDLVQKNDYLVQEELFNRLTDSLSNTFEGVSALVFVHYQGNMLVLLIDSDGQDEAMCREKLKAAADNFLHVGVCALRIGVGGMVRQISEIGESFEQANSEVFSLPGEAELPQGTDISFVYDRAEILSAAGTRDLKAIEDAAEEILTAAKRQCLPYREAETILQDMYKTVMEAQRRLSPTSSALSLPAEKDEFSALEVLILSPDINVSPLLVALLRHIPYQPAQGENGTEDIARRLKKYIDEHYDEELSLEILADKVKVSAKYLSRVFKQCMGVNLSDYLAYVRVERIKELLKTDLPLEKISEQVGITNRTTFTRTFRKLEGVTPSEWRAAQKTHEKEAYIQ